MKSLNILITGGVAVCLGGALGATVVAMGHAGLVPGEFYGFAGAMLGTVGAVAISAFLRYLDEMQRRRRAALDMLAPFQDLSSKLNYYQVLLGVEPDANRIILDSGRPFFAGAREALDEASILIESYKQSSSIDETVWRKMDFAKRAIEALRPYISEEGADFPAFYAIEVSRIADVVADLVRRLEALAGTRRFP